VSSDPDGGVQLGPEAAVELDRRLALWASARRLRPDDLVSIRKHVLAHVSEPVAEVDSEPLVDADWLWSLLRPVTALLERSADVGEGNLSERVERWLQPLTGDRAYRPYLRLA
jgi:hypothetical protein